MAVEKIKMPQLGESVTEGTIINWIVSVGDHVAKYEPIAEVQTDKVTAEIPSSFTGTIHEIVATEGETLAVGELICYIETAQSASAIQNVTDRKGNENGSVSNGHANNVDLSMKKRFSPAVLRLAQENDINLDNVNGTGIGGRITRKDIQRVIDGGEKTDESKVEAPVVSTPTHQEKSVKVNHGDVEVPLTNVRKSIATNMVRSKSDIPHAWMMIEADVTELVNYRDSIKTEFKKSEGYNITYFAFFVKAVAQALKEVPMLNSTWAGDKIIQKGDINLSIAVGTESGLFVPVIKHADEKSIKGIAKEINRLAHKVRNGELTTEDIEGGTFTVNNTGAFGSIQSMGIINHPQAAILQVESIVKRPVVMGKGMLAIRDMVNLCISLDHRVLDGIICGKFLNRVKDILENTSYDNLSIH